MSMKLGAKVAGLVLAAMAVAFSFVPAAEATPIRYVFTVNVTTGPLVGTVEHGSFSYDSSSVIPGGFNNATGLLTALDFTFNGVTYNAGTANTGALGFDAAGNLNYFVFGNNCVAGTCVAVPNSSEFYVLPGLGFRYSTPSYDNVGEGAVTFARVPVAVPEPGALGLLGLGVFLIVGFAGLRRRTG